MSASPDLSKIIGLIMDNPELLDRIKTLAVTASSNEGDDVSAKEAIRKAEPAEPQAATADAQYTEEKAAPTSSTYEGRATHDAKRRRELLCALKPYVSSERSRAIDTMLSLAGVIDVMKRR